MKVVIELPGQPRGKGRPRFGHGHIYTDAQTTAYERSLAWQGAISMKGADVFTGPLRVTVSAFFEIPKSFSKEQYRRALIALDRPGKPDADNILKMVDGLNGIVWVDDAQLADVRIVKAYAATPLLRIEVEELNSD